MNYSDFVFDAKRTDCKICKGEIEDSFVSTDGQICIGGFEYSYCRSCDLYFINPEPNLSSVSVFYNSHGTPVSRTNLETQWNEYERQGRLYQWIESVWHLMPKVSPGERYLDFGCGAGLMLRSALGRGLSPSGVEISGTARLFAADNGLHVFPELPPRTELFSLISAIDVIEHLADPLLFVQQLKVRLCFEGTIFLRLPTIDGLLFNRRHPERWKWVYSPYHLNMFSIKSVSRLAFLSGMEIEIIIDEEMHCLKGHFYSRVTQDYPALSSRYTYPLLRWFLKRKYSSETIYCILRSRQPTTS